MNREVTKKSVLIAIILLSTITITIGATEYVKSSSYEKAVSRVLDVGLEVQPQYGEVQGMITAPYKTVVSYVVNNERYYGILYSLSQPKHSLGDSVNVYYNPKDPEVLRDDFLISMNIVLTLGLFAILAIVALRKAPYIKNPD